MTLLPEVPFERATLVTYACPHCKAAPTTTWITRAGDPYCPCDMARILGDASRNAAARGDVASAADYARRAIVHAFESRPDLREIDDNPTPNPPSEPDAPCRASLGRLGPCGYGRDHELHLPADQCPETPCTTPNAHHAYRPDLKAQEVTHV